MRINDAILGLIIIILSSLVIFESMSFPALPGVPYGPGLFPTIIACFMIVGGIILIFKGIKNLPITGWYELEEWARKRNTYFTLGIIFSVLPLPLPVPCWPRRPYRPHRHFARLPRDRW